MVIGTWSSVGVTHRGLAEGGRYGGSEVVPANDWSNLTSLLTRLPRRCGDGTVGGPPHCLLLWPTIPVTQIKGSDTRAVDAASVLARGGCVVDLLYHHDYATETKDSTYDDGLDLQRIKDAGVHRTFGPHDARPIGASGIPVALYDLVLTWVWPDRSYMRFLCDSIDYVKRANGLARLVVAVDDVGVSPRMLSGRCKNKTRTFDEIARFVLSERPSILVGSEKMIGTDPYFDAVSEFDEYNLWHGRMLLWQEMYLYVLADVVLGLNQATLDFLSKMVPDVSPKLLSYVAPVETDENKDRSFLERSGYLFFGFNNAANKQAMDWFGREVLPHVAPGHKFHIAGAVDVPSLCSCTGFHKKKCRATHPDVVCHGALTDDELNDLIRSSRVAINPVLEPSGVATKTCRAMSYGTPVVVSDLDGTFDATRLSDGAVRCPKGDVLCVADGINALLTNEEMWEAASLAAPGFVSEHFGKGRYVRDWISILNALLEKRLEIVIDGDSTRAGESMAAQNWHIAKMLGTQQDDLFHVTVMGKLDPPIEGVDRVDGMDGMDGMDGLSAAAGERRSGSGWLHYGTMQKEESLVESPFPTGFQADIVLRQSWPYTEPVLPFRMCGAGCRVAQILPWEFGSLPADWMSGLEAKVDWLLVFEKSGFDPAYTSVLRAGVDCVASVAKDPDDTTHAQIREGKESSDKGKEACFMDVQSSLYSNVCYIASLPSRRRPSEFVLPRSPTLKKIIHCCETCVPYLVLSMLAFSLKFAGKRKIIKHHTS